ncbi:dTMP kinase [Nitrosomonas ureae]|uniref:Thymidylate kinase n=1 Tax=Nitrosomonas ureae TaxID=44577 RepID=A0A1H2DP41_9PROT|nr:dTMP kinase [Nitrosomonas ureae]ALQ49828.1 thymidylate kinase [Nitrosomonas ureae]SDT84650.1 thymidylate kinase [Nitrosomonas ureae]
MKQGKFITLEGIDGAGKSTQLAWIAELLQRAGKRVVVSREPGGTALGEQLRALLLDKSITMHAETETLLMFAARREHLDKVILPALAQDQWVLSDRFTDASFAYQSGGRGLNSAKLDILEQWVQGTLQPDLTLYFDVPADVGQQRVSRGGVVDRFEQEQADFFLRVRAAYLDRAQRFSDRIKIIDSNRSLPEVKAAVEQVLQSLLHHE